MKRLKSTMISLSASIVILLTGCGGNNEENTANNETAGGDYPQLSETVADNEQEAVIHTNKGEIYVKLFPDAAPLAVENFITLSEEGYYDGVIFHRVIENFMIQGGDPDGTGMGGESAFGEAFEDEFDESLAHFRGALSMANSGPDTNASQFFIVQAGPDLLSEDDLQAAGLSEELVEIYMERGGTPHLDNAHTVFGQVIEGLDVVDDIATVETEAGDRPTEDVVIETIEIIE
ncbi:peptidylprolyl isomerase [Salipaludibacillus agaradhaerens]|uniref:Peptidyl-prolyl cis-trans isomerase n=1 Tax=Salipaludibacillus agaradhaerens TaxID=76935 RepID=A0A9Q4B0S2_SALAG|nr:peptidylprolyl isomerase [Salipaludibacillus agaradhaerens]MCR6096209.1 peptidylprolyl isomerase [Salipaludibacillus agaradhaerens]MCR6114232.1 peptidylprolyl isomerase [Salipaludibacillus agaradhaerens]